MDDERIIPAKFRNFTPVFDAVTAKVGPMAALVYGRVWRYCQMADHVCRASQERIAADLGVSRKFVNEQLARLVEAGYLIDLSPEVRNRPHVYRDALKINLRVEITADEEDPDVPDVPKRPKLGGATVTPPANSDDGCNPNGPLVAPQLHRGVTDGYMSQTLLRDSLRDEEGDSNSISPQLETAWDATRQQLSLQMRPGDYRVHIKHLQLVSGGEGTLVLGAPTEYSASWVRDRLTTTIARQIEPLVGVPVKIEIIHVQGGTNGKTA